MHKCLPTLHITVHNCLGTGADLWAPLTKGVAFIAGQLLDCKLVSKRIGHPMSLAQAATCGRC